MRLFARACAVFVLGWLVLSPVARAADGRLVGRLTKPGGAPLVGVEVAIDALGLQAISDAAGEFARVDAGSDCLNLRAEPSALAEVLGCYATGVLLEVTGPERDGWLPVAEPGGAAGFASGEFLVR